MLLLVTGASGVGKSTVRAMVEPELGDVECVELVDLASRPFVVSRAWRQQMAQKAAQRAIELRASGRPLLLCGDPVPAAELVAAPSARDVDAIAVCLLDASPDAQAARLTARGDDPSLLADHQAFAEWMRRQATDPLHMPHVVSDGGWAQMRWERLPAMADRWRMHTIDTSHLSRREVADSVLEWCRRALRGDAPVLHVADVLDDGHVTD